MGKAVDQGVKSLAGFIVEAGWHVAVMQVYIWDVIAEKNEQMSIMKAGVFLFFYPAT